MRRPDAALVTQEFELAARMLRHACRRAELMAAGEGATPEQRRLLDGDLREIIREYERLWLARNRHGGLRDSVARLEAARALYQV